MHPHAVPKKPFWRLLSTEISRRPCGRAPSWERRGVHGASGRCTTRARAQGSGRRSLSTHTGGRPRRGSGRWRASAAGSWRSASRSSPQGAGRRARFALRSPAAPRRPAPRGSPSCPVRCPLRCISPGAAARFAAMLRCDAMRPRHSPPDGKRQLTAPQPSRSRATRCPAGPPWRRSAPSPPSLPRRTTGASTASPVPTPEPSSHRRPSQVQVGSAETPERVSSPRRSPQQGLTWSAWQTPKSTGASAAARGTGGGWPRRPWRAGWWRARCLPRRAGTACTTTCGCTRCVCLRRVVPAATER